MVNKTPALSSEDDALWKANQKNITPLKNRPEVELPKNTRVEISRENKLEANFILGNEAPAQNQLTRRDAKKIAKGDVVIEGKLDLHGSTKEASYHNLLSFIERGISQRKKCLLVVTGKGGKRFSQTKSTPMPQRKYDDFNHGSGVLKNAVPEWLSLSPFTHYVASFREAHAAHGGDGAYYIILRRVKVK
jgi:DNA-nicking Smr family endonuclease